MWEESGQETTGGNGESHTAAKCHTSPTAMKIKENKGEGETGNVAISMQSAVKLLWDVAILISNCRGTLAILLAVL